MSFITIARKFSSFSRLYCTSDAKFDSLTDYFTKILRNESYNLKLAPYFLDPHNVTLNFGPTSIIDNPAEKLTLEMINFDCDKNLERVEYVFSKSNQWIRDKYIYIINQGPGGGTTRILEELKMMVNKRPECLAIAITYGHEWALTKDEVIEVANEQFPFDNRRGERIADVGAVFSVITRMTAMLYGLSLSQALHLYRENLSQMPKLEYNAINYALAGFMKAVVEELRYAGRSVSKVLFLIDETAQVNELLNTLIKPENSWSRTDAWRKIRDSLLGEYILTGANVTTALVLASVDYSDLKLEGSSRPFISVTVPEELPSPDIVWKWWLPRLARHGISVPEDQIPLLEVYAAACEQSPLAAEVYSDALIQQLMRDSTLTPEAYKAISADAFARVKEAYPDVKALPKDKYLLWLLLSSYIEADEEVMHLLQSSLFSNCIENLRYDGYKRPMLSPRASFIVLAVAAEQDHLRYKTLSVRNSHAVIAETIVELYTSLVHLTADGDFDTLARKILCAALKISLVCSASYDGVDDRSFFGLLHIGSLRSLRRYELGALLPKGDVDEVYLPCHVTDPVGFYSVLADPANVPTEDKAYVLFHPTTTADKADLFDLAFAAYDGPDLPPKIFFLQFSSPDKGLPAKRGRPPKNPVPVRVKGLQYTATRKLLMDDPLPEGVSPTGLLGLIRDAPGADAWLYLYMARDAEYTESWVEDNCVILAAGKVRGLLEPFRSIYEACRRVTESKK